MALIKLVLSQVTCTSEGASKVHVHQGATLLHYDHGLCSHSSDVQKLSKPIKHEPAWSDTELLCSLVFFLSWTLLVWQTPGVLTDSDDTGSDDKAEIREAMDHIVTLYSRNLYSVCIFPLREDLDEIDELAIFFYRKYLKNQAEGYQKVQTFHARKWPSMIHTSE